MPKRKPIKKHVGASASYYEHQDKYEREKGSVGFNTGPEYSKTGRMKSYYVTSEDWHHKQLSHGMARGHVGVKAAKRFTHGKYPHKWVKFHVTAHGYVRKKG
jgi:hypothetical protein